MSQKCSLKKLLSTAEQPFHEVLLRSLQDPKKLSPLTDFLKINDDRSTIAILCLFIINGCHIPDEAKPQVAKELIDFLPEYGWTMIPETILALVRLNACEQLRQAVQEWHDKHYEEGGTFDAMSGIAEKYKKLSPALDQEWKTMLRSLIRQWNEYLDEGEKAEKVA